MLTVVMAVECSGLVLNAGVTRYSDLVGWHDELIQAVMVILSSFVSKGNGVYVVCNLKIRGHLFRVQALKY